ncbi:MAG: GNAT family N-acetyltransferase [Bacteroidetes bacterium]|nr:GNAT family N-acetyltransferase [Bacteroidota bacterium]
MDKKIVLTGNGFILRDWKNGDEISLQKNADNPNVSRYLMDRFPYPYPLEAAIAWVNSQVGLHPVLNFAIDIAGEIAGGMAIELKEDVHRKTGVIGYWLAEQYWGQGIMTEAVKLLTAYAFGHFDLVRLQACVYSKNYPSMRVLEKAGYHKEAVLQNAVFKNGELLDEHVYAILK